MPALATIVIVIVHLSLRLGRLRSRFGVEDDGGEPMNELWLRFLVLLHSQYLVEGVSII